MVNVLLTVDTEVWPVSDGWPHRPLRSTQGCERELAAYFWGGDGEPRLGLPYQLETLRKHRLKATYFVDPLFSFPLGLEPLRKVVTAITGAGQEIGLHLHPEWLTDPRCEGLPSFAGPLIRQYARSDQSALIGAGRRRLREAGAPAILAFRAGSWGADLGTVAALKENGVPIDSSLNACFAASFPDLAERETFLQPWALDGVCEFPVTTFVDIPPHHRRPLHVCASSLQEFRIALEHAFAERWLAVVLVLHSFEFVRVERLATGRPATPQRLIADRFERLCRYLADNADRFRTRHFEELDLTALPSAAPRRAAESSRIRTLARQVEQFASRFY